MWSTPMSWPRRIRSARRQAPAGWYSRCSRPGIGIRPRWPGTRADTVAYISDSANWAALKQEFPRTDGNDIIDGGDGNDVIFGQEGNDTIIGGTGADTIDGGSGTDTITGGAGADTIDGGSGDDTIDGDDGDDVIFGQEGNDTITGGAGVDTIDSGSGNDIVVMLVTGGNVDAADGGEGNDTLELIGAVPGDEMVYSDYSASPAMTRSQCIGGVGNDPLVQKNFENIDGLGIGQFRQRHRV